MYKRILVPLDGSKRSEEVLPLVRLLANMCAGEIVLLRVAEYPYKLYSNFGEYPSSDPGLVKIMRNKKRVINREVQHYLERIATMFASDKIKVTLEICEGPVVEAILESTDRHHVDVIILSTCGQSGCAKWGIGAVADRLLHDAPVPVILIRSALGTFDPGLSLKEYRTKLTI